MCGDPMSGQASSLLSRKISEKERGNGYTDPFSCNQHAWTRINRIAQISHKNCFNRHKLWTQKTKLEFSQLCVKVSSLGASLKSSGEQDEALTGLAVAIRIHCLIREQAYRYCSFLLTI